jgi:hypothetical protein
MPLITGTRIGVYEVIAPIGAGGMGEVYRARDTTLNRDVALKVLPDSVAGDPDRLARFRREAQALAALNHSHIAQIYGVEQSAGTQALVMEFVPGKTLHDIIRAGPLALPDAVAIARQIADALETAHDAGIIHRDLKPLNIKVRDDGTVKVLDFGLAKASTPNSIERRTFSPEDDPANSPTLMSPARTEIGVLIGTAAYMSPEQAAGRAVDKRADIWAFGCVLYEMLTGERQFGGDTVQETIAAVIKDPPRLDRLPDEVPRTIRQLLARCLDRDPRTRLRDIGEARVLLSRIDDPEAIATPAAAAPARRSRVTVALAAASVVLTALAGIVAWQMKPTGIAPVRRFDLPAAIAAARDVAIAPDGSRLAYLTGRHLYVHAFADASAQDLGEVPPASQGLFWSTDGRTIGFGAQGALRTRPSGGGPDFIVCKVPGAGRLMAAVWRPDNTIVFAAWRDSLYRVPAAGGTPVVLVAANPATDIDFHTVASLPDGRLIVARHARSDDSEHLEVVEGGSATALTDDRLIGAVEYRAPGILLFVRRGANKGVWAVPFDKPPMDFSRAVLLAAGATSYAASADGTLVHITTPLAASELVWATRTGGLSAVPGAAIELTHQDLRLSPEGNRAALIVGGNTILIVRDLRTGVETRLTTPNSGDPTRTSQSVCPAWFPAGDRILYGYGAAEATALYSKEATGTGTARKLIAGLCGVVSPDGRELYYNTDERGLSRLRRAPIAPDGTIGASSLLLPADDESDVGLFDLSADGTLLAYEAKQQDQQINVWITDVPNGTSRWQVTTGGGRLPRFGRNGRELFHVAPAGAAPSDRMGALMAVPLTTKPAFAMAARQTLFTLDQPGGPLSAGGYDVAPDGRFLFTRTAAPTGEKPRAVLVQNWIALIRK